MRRTKADAQKTRQDILDAGLKIFTSKGFASASLQEISTEAGVTRGAVYWHFKDKLELYCSLFNESVSEFGEIIADIHNSDMSPLTKIRSIMIELFANLEGSTKIKRIMELLQNTMESSPELRTAIHDSIQELMQSFHHTLCTIIIEGKTNGEIRTETETEDIAQSINCFIHGVSGYWIHIQNDFSLKEKAGIFADILIHGISNN